MSRDGSGLVKVAKIEEGEKLQREDINSTNQSWEYASERVTGKNIREEGLDRRVFEYDNTWGDYVGTNGKSYMGSLQYLRTHGTTVNTWVPVETHDGTFRGGISSDSPTIAWSWNPDVDTYCIIRASFFFYWDLGDFGHVGRDEDGKTIARNSVANQDYKFGIAVRRFNEDTWEADSLDFRSGTGSYSGGYNGVRRLDNADGDIFAVQQIALARDWNKYTSRIGPIEYQYDRRTAYSSSFTMVASGSSTETDHTFKLSRNMCAIDMRQPGKYVAVLLMRYRNAVPLYIGRSSAEPGGSSGLESRGSHLKEHGKRDPRFGYLNFFVQKFRR